MTSRDLTSSFKEFRNRAVRDRNFRADDDVRRKNKRTFARNLLLEWRWSKSIDSKWRWGSCSIRKSSVSSLVLFFSSSSIDYFCFCLGLILNVEFNCNSIKLEVEVNLMNE